MFFIMPIVCLFTGIMLILFVKYKDNCNLRESKVDLSIFSINKDAFILLSEKRGRDFVRILANGTIVCTLATALVAAAFSLFAHGSIFNTILCIALQTALMFIAGKPWYDKLCELAKLV